MKARAHPSQPMRLATLRSYDILDTPRETDFDEIVELVAKICDVPISVINLIDEDRQWFKAEVGLGTRETPLETSICSHVILESDYVEIHDTHADPRTRDNELCMPEDGLRFYAGVLLTAPNGLPIGTLCVLDYKPNKLDDLQKQALTTLARSVMRELDLRVALRDQQILRDEMDHRVKNSLQTIASLVRVYKTRTTSADEVKAAFDAISRRISAVAALHEALHTSPDSSSVQLDKYLSQIADHLRASAPDHVEIRCTAEPISVSPKVASAIAVIVSESVANSLKHAFGVRADGRIDIALSRLPDSLIITCKDNGGSVADLAAPVSSTGLGLRLVKAACTQVGGQLVSEQRDDGYYVELTIPAHAITSHE